MGFKVLGFSGFGVSVFVGALGLLGAGVPTLVAASGL